MYRPIAERCLPLPQDTIILLTYMTMLEQKNGILRKGEAPFCYRPVHMPSGRNAEKYNLFSQVLYGSPGFYVPTIDNHVISSFLLELVMQNTIRCGKTGHVSSDLYF